jgi:hypothetical protein
VAASAPVAARASSDGTGGLCAPGGTVPAVLADVARKNRRTGTMSEHLAPLAASAVLWGLGASVGAAVPMKIGDASRHSGCVLFLPANRRRLSIGVWEGTTMARLAPFS